MQTVPEGFAEGYERCIIFRSDNPSVCYRRQLPCEGSLCTVGSCTTPVVVFLQSYQDILSLGQGIFLTGIPQDGFGLRRDHDFKIHTAVLFLILD